MPKIKSIPRKEPIKGFYRLFVIQKCGHCGIYFFGFKLKWNSYGLRNIEGGGRFHDIRTEVCYNCAKSNWSDRNY